MNNIELNTRFRKLKSTARKQSTYDYSSPFKGPHTHKEGCHAQKKQNQAELP